MFSHNSITRRRQQKATVLFAASGVVAAIGISKALCTPTPTPSSVPQSKAISLVWQVRLTADNLLLVRNVRTGQRTLLAPLNNPKIEQVTGFAVSGANDDITVYLQKISGAGSFGYILRDCTQTWDANTGILRTQRFH